MENCIKNVTVAFKQKNVKPKQTSLSKTQKIEKKKKIPYPEPMFHVPFDESFSVYPMTPFLIQNIYKPYCGSLTNDFEGHIHPQ